jgi:hypothetical protein
VVFALTPSRAQAGNHGGFLVASIMYAVYLDDSKKRVPNKPFLSDARVASFILPGFEGDVVVVCLLFNVPNYN